MIDKAELVEFFGLKGGLEKSIEGYQPRIEQLAMAETVATAINNRQNLIAEAGTGTGKTFAYLAPAILSGKKVIVSTGTKNLQDQLFNKDLPLVRQALGLPVQMALLKGRSNYLCWYRLNNTISSHAQFEAREVRQLAKIKQWANRTQSGDTAEMGEVPENSPLWFQATSNAENCLGVDCGDYDRCFLMEARKKAQEAEILVVNHHLLCADWAIKEGGFGELLPETEVIIVDEAHQLADVASNFLGISLGGRQLSDLAADVLVEYFKDARDIPELRDACEDLSHQVMVFRSGFGIELRKGEWQELENDVNKVDDLDALGECLQQLTQLLEVASVKTKELEVCFQRSTELVLRLQGMRQSDDGQWIRWYEIHKNSFNFSKTPLDIASEFQQFMASHKASWVFTSATLSVDEGFDHFTRSLGVEEALTASWDSPFDFENQSLFYHPRHLPQPSDPLFIDAVVDVAIPVIEACEGKTFFLFTSHWALRKAAKLLENRLDYPLLIQGDSSKTRLLEEFKRLGNAVLLGTASFWEGVDVRGEALSCVIIDKLPFAAPSDPVLKARLQAIDQAGRNSFMEHQVPAAVIALRQGVGRLIRDVDDNGVLLLCDPRLLKRSYGHAFLNSLPAMKRTREIEEVQLFFEKIKSNET